MTIKPIAYKALRPKDKKRIQELLGVFVQKNQPITNKDIQRAMKCPEHTLLAAVDKKGEIVGIADLIEVNLFVGRTGIIDEVVVHPALRGKGIGTRLLKEAVKLAKKKGMRHLKLDTRADNPANKLYEKAGFVRKEDNVYKLYLR